MTKQKVKIKNYVPINNHPKRTKNHLQLMEKIVIGIIWCGKQQKEKRKQMKKDKE